MDSKPDPVNSVLSTAELREMIMKHLDTLSLLNCRLVSKSWSATASSVLKKRPVWITREWNSQAFRRLFKCVKRSTNFPFSKLNLRKTARSSAKVDCGYAVKLFASFGDLFTHLSTFGGSVKWHTEMTKKLLKAATKLEYLQLGVLPSYARDEDPRFLFPSLRTLNFGFLHEGDKRVLVEIIRAAPRLQEIRRVNCDYAIQMAALRRIEKQALVSTLSLRGEIQGRIFLQLNADPPKLTALTLTVETNENLEHFQAVLKAILIKSQNSLKFLNFGDYFDQLADLPVLHTLEELGFRMDFSVGHPHNQAVLPLLSNSLFPKLKTVQLYAWKEEITEDFIRKNFWEAYDSPLESVDKLKLETYCEPAAIEYLAKLFPRVTYVTVNYKGCNYGTGNRQHSNIWLLKAFPRLSKLQILDHPFKYGTMDTFLTGIPNEILAKFRTAPKQTLSPCMNEILRPRGNILQLKNLKELIVTIIPSSSPFKPSRENPFMTLVSIWYGLEMIPGLYTRFLYCTANFRSVRDYSQDFHEAFEPVKDHVTIGQCFCETH